MFAESRAASGNALRSVPVAQASGDDGTWHSPRDDEAELGKVDDNNNNEPDNSKLGSDGPSSPGAVANAYLKTSVSPECAGKKVAEPTHREVECSVTEVCETDAVRGSGSW